jgi:ABC-type transport system substrate-binding protein
MKKKLISVMLVAAMCMGMTACGGGSSDAVSDSTSTQGQSAGADTDNSMLSDSAETVEAGTIDTMTVAISADGGTFDPYAGFVNWGTAALNDLMYGSLITIDYDYNIYNYVAKDIEQVDDTTWSLEIWDNVTDTAGNQITIDDIIWCYDKFIESGNAGGIPKFDHWEKIDDYHANMIVSEPFGTGDMVKHFGNVKIISQASYEANDFTTSPIGCGPYKLASYTVNSEVVLEINEDFWMNDIDQENPLMVQNAKTIKYEIIQDASSRAIALEMGDVDLVDSMDAADVANLASSDAISTVNLPQRPPVAFSLNANEASVLSNKDLRQAVLYALDNDAIAEAIGLPAQACYGLQPNMVDAPESWTTGEGRSYYDYDVDKAQELLTSGGYNGETIKLLYISSTANDAAAIMMQSELKAVGVTVELVCVDETTAQDMKYDPTAWDLRLDTMGGGAYISQTVKSWWKEDITRFVPEGSGWNTSLVADSTLDGLYEALKDDPSDENISAWDEYFNDMAYGYAICTYSNQTACNSAYTTSILTSNGGLSPNTFVPVQ